MTRQKILVVILWMTGVLDPFVLAASLVIIAGILWNLHAKGRAKPA